MMSSPSGEEKCPAFGFGLRLSNSMAKYGPLCVGIDPHRQLLTDWGYNVDALGAELYSMRMLQAPMGVPQLSNSILHVRTLRFQRHRRARTRALCGTADGCHHHRRLPAWQSADHDFRVRRTPISSRARHCWPTPSPCCRITAHGRWEIVINDALNNGRGVFIASLTSNQEGASLQTAIRQAGEYKGKTVAYGIASTAQKIQ